MGILCRLTSKCLIVLWAAVSLFACSETDGSVKLVAEGGCIHRFFDTSPISPSGKYIALFRFPYEDRSPRPGDVGEVFVQDIESGEVLFSTKSCGWEMQLGANVQWGKSDEELFYNDVDTTTWEAYAVRLNFKTGEKERCAGTVFMVSPDGGKLLSYDLCKSHFAQVGYGVIVPDSVAERNVGPVANDGVYVTDLKTDRCRMIASLADIYEKSVPSIAISNPEDYEYYCFQVKWNLQGTRVLTTVQWTPLSGGERCRAVITMKPDGSDIRTAITPEQWACGGHHINWLPDGDHLSMNLNVHGREGVEIVSVKYDGTDLKEVYPTGSGHPSYNVAGLPYIVTDAYAGEVISSKDMTPIRLINYEQQTEYNLAEVYLPPIRNFEFRVDAHPAWDRTGRYVVFNGMKDGHRCVYMAEIKH